MNRVATIVRSGRLYVLKNFYFPAVDSSDLRFVLQSRVESLVAVLYCTLLRR